MDIVNSVTELEKIFKDNYEVIIYGAGGVGRKLLQYASYKNIVKNICCFAVKSRENNPEKISGWFVLELNCLQHYKDSACFVVATTEEKHKEIFEELKQFGCKNIVFVSSLVVAAIEKINGVPEDTMLEFSRGIKSMIAAINNMSVKMEEQNEICAVNTAAFREYRNCNRGKEVVIVASGPTLNYYSPVKDAVHIGVNHAWRKANIELDYYFVQDGKKEWREKMGEGIKKLSCKTFVGRYSKNCIYNYIEFPEEYSVCRESISRYFVGMSVNEMIYKDICFHAVMDFGSIVFPALHFAIYTYPKRIYLVGCDTTNDGYFSGETKNAANMNIKNVKMGFARFKAFVEQYYPDTEIISINPRGLKGLFKDVYTDEYLKEALITV